MTTYNTGNPLGSTDPRDLYDNAENFDEAVNSEESQWVDRFGRPRLPLMEQERQFVSDQERREGEFQGAQADRQQRFKLLLANSGYEYLADYAAGIEITEYNQVLRDAAGELWRAAATTTLPYTTDGTGLPEGGAFVAVGDAPLRNDLSNDPSVGRGALLVRGAAIYVNTIADLQALDTTVLDDGRVVYLAGREFIGDGGEGYFRWSQNDYSFEVAEDIADGIYIAPNSDETGSSGAWVRQFSNEINLSWFNIPKNEECSKEIQSVINMMTDGVNLFIPNREEPYIIERIDFSNLNNFRVYSDGALFIREPEGTSIRESGTFLAFVFFTNCNNFSVSGLRLEGNHTKVPFDVSSDDNQQAGFQFSNCNMCEISNCRMRYFNTSMVVRDTSEFTIYRCRSQFTRTGFRIDGSSSDGIIEACVAKDARMHPSGTATRINTGGYGFLHDGSGRRILFQGCTSYRSGSTCFRTQGTGSEIKFDSCSSVDASGYGFSIFSIKSAVTNCDVINISDPSIWDGSDFFEIRVSSKGYVFSNASYLIIDNCRYFPSEFSPVECTAFDATTGTFDYDTADYVTISNCQAHHSILFAMATGFSAKDLTLINNKAYGFEMTKHSELYAVRILSSAENARVESNLISGYERGVFLSGEGACFQNNKVENISTYGVRARAPHATIIGNTFRNCGLNEINAASIFVEAPYSYITDNTVSGDPLLMQGRRSLWLSAAATEAFLGPLQHQGVDAVVLLSAPLANSALPAFGKSVEAPNSTAQTVEELRSDLNSVLQKMRDANLIDQ